eukprot:713599-Prorocentrum_minimum.AAC.1
MFATLVTGVLDVCAPCVLYSCTREEGRAGSRSLPDPLPPMSGPLLYPFWTPSGPLLDPFWTPRGIS